MPKVRFESHLLPEGDPESATTRPTRTLDRAHETKVTPSFTGSGSSIKCSSSQGSAKLSVGYHTCRAHCTKTVAGKMEKLRPGSGQATPVWPQQICSRTKHGDYEEIERWDIYN